MDRFDQTVKDFYKDPDLIVLLRDKETFIALENDAVLIDRFLRMDNFKFTEDEPHIMYLLFPARYFSDLNKDLTKNKMSFAVIFKNSIDLIKRFRSNVNRKQLESIKIRGIINDLKIRKFDFAKYRKGRHNLKVDQARHEDKIYHVKNKVNIADIKQIEKSMMNNEISCVKCKNNIIHNCNKNYNEGFDCFEPLFRVAPGETENWPKEMEFKRKSLYSD